MDGKQKRLRPKLDRRNAIKNIDYDASSFDDDHSSQRSGLRGRSLELYQFSDTQSSFRMNGKEGEFDLICRSLGLSGPEDFVIPTTAWEAQKARTSSYLASRSPLRIRSSSPKQEEHHGDFSAATGVLGAADSKQKRPNLAQLESRVRPSLDSLNIEPSGGIRGARPPVLSPVPVDNVASTGDMLKIFAPPENHTASKFTIPNLVDENEVSRGLGWKKDSKLGMRVGETESCLASCSSRSNYDDNGDHDAVVSTSSVLLPRGRFRRSITSWQKGDLLGSGSFGTVYEGFTEDGFFFAVKEVSLLDQGNQGKQSILQLEQEISLLSQFEHENIVRYLGTDKDESKLYIFLELVTKGSLSSLYHKYRLKDSQVSAYTRHILNGLRYLHDRNVVHRDIKCANILVDANGSVKLADFGLAKATKLNDVRSCKGTPFWMAPEVINQKNRGYGLAADIWSLGCTVLEMFMRQPPYSHLEGMQALFVIGKGEPPPVPDSLSTDARDFIVKCIQVNPNDRPSAAQLLDHAFVRRHLQNSFEPAFY